MNKAKILCLKITLLFSLLAAGCRRDAPPLSLPRFAEPRLSITSSFSPCELICPQERSLCLSSCLGEQAMPPFLKESVSVVSEPEACTSSPYTNALCLLGSAKDQEDFERAIAMLESLSHFPQVTVQGDLGAAYLIRAQRFDTPADLVRSWEAILEAKRDRSAPAFVHFNEAIACDELGLRECSQNAAAELFKSDPDSDWAQEIENRLAQSLEASSTRDATPPSQLLSEAIEGSLGAWALATTLREDTKASEALMQFDRMAAGLARLDAHYLTAITRDIARDLRSNPERLRLVAKAHLEVVEDNPQAAFEDRHSSLERAAAQLRRVESPLAIWAELELAELEFLHHEHESFLERVGPLREASPTIYRLIHAKALSYTAAGSSQQYRLLEAIAGFEQALKIYASLGDTSGQASVQIRLAELYDWTGREAPSWRHRLAALRQLNQLDDVERFFVLTEASIAARSRNLIRTATELQYLAVEASTALNDPNRTAIGLRYLADCYLELGNPKKALALLEETRGALAKTTEGDLRKSIALLVEELAGRATLTQDPQQSIEYFNTAIDYSLELSYSIPRASLYAQRAQVWLKLDRPELAHSDLEEALATLEAGWRIELESTSDRRRVEGQDVWRAYFDQGRGLFDTLIRSLVSAGRGEDALLVSERAKAQELLYQLDHSAFPELLLPSTLEELNELRQGLPKDAVILSYWLLADQVVIWRIDHEAVTTKTVALDRRFIAARIGAMLGGLTDATAAQHQHEPLLRELHLKLIETVEPAIEREDLLIVVPDGALHTVPFAALLGQEGFLIERHPIAVAPSVALAAGIQSPRSTDATSRPPSALVIRPAFDAQRFDGEEFPALPPLPGATAEARQVAEIYHPESRLIADAEATSSMFARLAPAYEIIHFAGHAVGTPQTSYLIMTPDRTAPSGALYPQDLVTFSFSKARVVVLSACSSLGGHTVGSLGVSRFARPLFGAGAPTVVGSLWDVRDQAVAELMTVFHNSLAQGLGPAASLRTAQRHMLRQEVSSMHSIAAWAAFQAAGNAY